jgi:hypothetical protein
MRGSTYSCLLAEILGKCGSWLWMGEYVSFHECVEIPIPIQTDYISYIAD